MKKLLLTLVLSGISILGFSQGAADALRYSNLTHNGDARFMGMGGAFGALGGNISSFNNNPAGIGLFRKSDASITGYFNKIESKSTYNANMAIDSDNNFQVSNAGIVLTNNYMNIYPTGGWKNFQFGLSYNMLQNFNNKVYISGMNNNNSIGDMYSEIAQGLSVNDIENNGANAFDLTPAWFSYLFNETTTPGTYVSAAPPVAMHQSKLIESWGSLSEIALTFGGNHSDRLYLGATIGIPILEYHEIATYRESTDEDITLDYYRSALAQNFLDTRAHGINLKLGMIYKANDAIRLGAAIHTPTYYYDINDEWSARIGADYDDASYLSDSPNGYYEYHLTTPMKAIASVAFVFSKFGLISLDYEYLDYASAKLNADDYNFDAENDDIDILFRSTSNLRIGTEWKFMNFSFRGGYGFYGSPYENANDFGEKKIYSLGAGYRDGNFYFDVAWTRMETDDQYTLYGYGNVFTNPADIKTEITNLIFTFGVRF